MFKCIRRVDQNGVLPRWILLLTTACIRIHVCQISSTNMATHHNITYIINDKSHYQYNRNNPNLYFNQSKCEIWNQTHNSKTSTTQLLNFNQLMNNDINHIRFFSFMMSFIKLHIFYCYSFYEVSILM